MPSKDSKVKLKYYTQLQKVTNKVDNLQGGVVADYDNFGRAVIKTPSGNTYRKAVPFAIGSLGIGSLVNPAPGGVPKYDFASSSPIPVASSPGEFTEEEIGEIKVLYTYTTATDLVVMLGGHTETPIEIVTFPRSTSKGNTSIIGSALESTGPGLTDYIVDLRVVQDANWEVYTYYGNSSDGTDWSLSESPDLDQRPVRRLDPKGSGFWDGSLIFPNFMTTNTYADNPQELLSTVTPVIPAYTETTVNNSSGTADPALSYTELKTDPNDVFSDTSLAGWQFTGTNLVDCRIEQIQSNYNTVTARYDTVTWTERDHRFYQSQSASMSAYRGSLDVKTGTFFYGWNVTTSDVVMQFDYDTLTNTGGSQYTVSSISGGVVDIQEQYDWVCERTVAPGIVQTQYTNSKPVTYRDGTPFVSVGDTIPASEISSNTSGQLPLAVLLNSYRLSPSAFPREQTNAYTSRALNVFAKAEIVYYSESTLVNDPADDNQVGPRFGYYIGVVSSDSTVTEQKIKTNTHGTLITTYSPNRLHTAIETGVGIDFYRVLTNVSDAAFGSFTASVQKEEILAGTQFTKNDSGTEVTEHNVLQLKRADGTSGSVNVLRAKYYPLA